MPTPLQQSAATAETLDANQGYKTLYWLNAYNAPHWMELFGTSQGSSGQITGNAHNPTGLPGWRSTQTGTVNSDQVERFGVSWMYDLMTAKTLYSPTSLQTGYQSRFNGVTDANLVRSPDIHKSHDLGMALDLGIGDYLNLTNQGAVNESAIAAVLATPLTDPSRADHWSDANAAQLAGLLSGRGPFPYTAAQQTQIDQAIATRQFINPLSNAAVWPGVNDQRAALMDFAALYSVTQRDGGTWGSIVLRNADNASNDIRRGLFGGGSGDNGLVSKVLIGDAAYTSNGVFHPLDRNPLTNIRNALSRLGVTADSADAHQNHFHVYLRPPAPVRIGGGAAWLQAEPNAVTAGSAQNSTEWPILTEAWADLRTGSIYIEDISHEEPDMLWMDLPPVEQQEAPQVIAQASIPTVTLPGQYSDNAQPSATAQAVKPDVTLLECIAPGHNTMSPEVAVSNYFYLKLRQKLDVDSARVELVQGAKHGQIAYYHHPQLGKTGWRYSGSTEVPDGVKTYPQGVDQVAFLVTIKNFSTGKLMNVKLIERLGVSQGSIRQAEENCNAPKPPVVRIGLIDAGVDYTAWQQGAELRTLIAQASQSATGYEDLPASALGRTTGFGPSTQITLDTTAAGHGWYIDATPLSNDEYLPTADPNVWKAKAGSQAEGKMDLLTVLLHDYGHALGLAHSDEAHAAMAATLTLQLTGVRSCLLPISTISPLITLRCRASSRLIKRLTRLTNKPSERKGLSGNRQDLTPIAVAEGHFSKPTFPQQGD